MAKDANFRTLIDSYTRKNEIIIQLFVQKKRKRGGMAFLTSRSASKHVHFALGVDPTVRDTGVMKICTPRKYGHPGVPIFT